MKKKLVVALLMILTISLLSVACSKGGNEMIENTNETETLDGHWTGGIKVPDSPLHIQIDLQQEKQSTEGVISIPAQGLVEYPLKFVDVEKDTIELGFELQGQLMTFNGNIESEKMTGTYKQSGQSFDFELFKTEDASDLEGEWIEADTSNEKLKGKLLEAKEDDKSPVLLIIPGSGPTDFNGNSSTGENDSLKMLAKSLADRGVASLRYDKRGVGKNEAASIPEEDMRFSRMIDDAAIWLEQLEADDRFDKVGVVGHSQGSLVGMEAAREQDADLFISLAGPGRTIDEVMQEQFKHILSDDDLLEESQSIFDVLERGETVRDGSDELMSILIPEKQPFLSSWMMHDPASVINKLEAPVLIANGTNDVQVSESEAERLEEARPDADLLLIGGMSHVLKQAPDDRQKNLETYWNPHLPLSDDLITGIEDFLIENDWVDNSSSK